MQPPTWGFSEGGWWCRWSLQRRAWSGRRWGRHGTSVAGSPALGHPLITVAIFLRGTSRFQQEQLRKDKDITFRYTAHPTLRNPALSTMHLTPAEWKAAEAKPTGLGIHRGCQCLALVWGFSLKCCEPDVCFPLTWELIETPGFQQTPLDWI